MFTVGLADDQQLVRAGFSMVLGSQDDIEVVWEANNGREAVMLAQRQPVDVILMDIQMPVRRRRLWRSGCGVRRGSSPVSWC